MPLPDYSLYRLLAGDPARKDSFYQPLSRTCYPANREPAGEIASTVEGGPGICDFFLAIQTPACNQRRFGKRFGGEPE